MRKKLILGSAIFIAGILLYEVSFLVDVWIMRFLGGILWPIGMVMGSNATASLYRKKHSSDSPKEN